MIVMTLGIFALSYGLWRQKKWTLYLSLSFAILIYTKRIMYFGYISLYGELMVQLVIIGLIVINFKNLKSGLLQELVLSKY